MSTARGLFLFILIFIVIPWGLILTLRLSAAAAATTTSSLRRRTSR